MQRLSRSPVCSGQDSSPGYRSVLPAREVTLRAIGLHKVLGDLQPDALIGFSHQRDRLACMLLLPFQTA